MIHGYIYSSESKEPFDHESLTKLQEHSSRKNKEHRITGYLTFKQGIFIQYIEGPKSQLDQLIQNLKKDDRHTFINELYFEKPDRIFENWNMRYIDFDDLIEIGFHELLETAFFTINNSFFTKDESIEKINRMLEKIAEVMYKPN
ncbi:BLUF domain-containing protein [Flammeovirga sp. SubArs3]|uniref:BLUF domain-containing protein n=1 Tax=Flammeovirga sp. SubArs3 TaxID=2995316 RepID=UPI00248C4DD5|nr:BLUF domain-containing protein [Flammeovirga sp. SubArs3]